MRSTNLVVAGAKPNPPANSCWVKPAGAHAVAAHITMPARQGRDPALAEGAHALDDLADGGHAFPAPHETVGVPTQHGRFLWPLWGKLPKFPHARAPVVGMKTGPDRVGQAARNEAGEPIADFNHVTDDPLRRDIGDHRRRRIGIHLRRATGKPTQAKGQERSLTQPDCYTTVPHVLNISHDRPAGTTNGRLPSVPTGAWLAVAAGSWYGLLAR